MTARDSIVRIHSYVLPRPADSECEYRRFFHMDITSMDSLELWAEHQAATAALSALVRSGRDPVIVYGPGLTLSARWWLRERIHRTKGGHL